MRIYVKKELEDFNGKPIYTGENAPGEDPAPVAKLGDLIIESLIRRNLQTDQSLTIEAKERIWNLAKRIKNALDSNDEMGAVELPIEDISFIRKRVGQTHVTAIVGPCVEAMNWIPPLASIKE
jgi:hypothetical protein